MTSPHSSDSDGRSERPAHDFDDIYATGNPPWDIGRPQPAFGHLAEEGALVGRVLDVGCGTGEHALMAAALGHEAVGIDLSPRAIELATSKATERGLNVRFVVADALRLTDLGEQFDTVLDCGLFHVLGDDEREQYVENLAGVVPPGGRFNMLCFSDAQPGD